MLLGISPDTSKAQKKFADKESLPFTLLADADKKVAIAYGVLQEKNMYGKKIMGIARTTFIIPDILCHAGGVFVSYLEYTQETQRDQMTREEVDERLHKIMIAIHQNCYETAEKYGTPGNLVNGANIGGFVKVANAMLDQGLV